MHIGIDARLTYHQPAGISKYTLKLLHALASLNTEDDFSIFQHRKQTDPLVKQANFRRVTLYTPTHNRIEQPLLALELKRYGLDLLHSTDFIPPLYSTVPSVITVHDLGFLRWPHFLTKDSAAYYGQIDRAVRHASHIIVPSEHTKEDLIGQLGAVADKVSVIYEAADPGFKPLPLESTRREVVQTQRLPEKFILFVGTIEPRKNVGGLLRAFRYLRDKYNIRDTGLVLVGKRGWLSEEIFEIVHELHLEECTFFTGRVSDDVLHKLYVAAQCHVHPAFYEGFGLPPLEAMACGTPTIVSQTSSLPEVVGDASLLIDPNDMEEIAVAIQRVLTDPDLHKELRLKGLKRARCFSWTQAAHCTMEVYQHVYAPRPAPAPQRVPTPE